MTRASAVILVVLGMLPSVAAAQDAGRAAVDLSGGYAGFVDEGPVHHGTLGAAVRWRLSPRVSVGPELVVMNGPGDDRDVFITGKAVLDFLPARRVSPYVVGDAGVMFHRDTFLAGSFTSREGAVSGGGGVRIDLTPRVSVAPEVRIGWEPHVRFAVLFTWRP